MTARDRICAKPLVVQEVLKAMMVKLSQDDPVHVFANEATLERYGFEALEWWEQEVNRPSFQKYGMGEIEIAERIIEGLRKQEVWGKILRGNAQ